MKTIIELSDLKGKRVIVRSSLNIPLDGDVIRNRFRLERALPTLRYLHEQGAKIILIAHIGRGQADTLKPVFAELEKFLPTHWGGSITGEEFKQRADLMSNGDILMAENIRHDEREKSNDENFAEQLAQFGDIYVNDAFANVHREHASMNALAKLLPAYAGLNVVAEVKELEKVMVPASPALFLLGGAKFDTKMPLVEKYLGVYDHVFIAGALMNDIFKAKGYEVGESMVSDFSLDQANFLYSEKLLLPIDVVVTGPRGTEVKVPTDVLPDEKIMDCGPATIEMLTTYINQAATILWNGPFGAYELGFTTSTEDTVKALSESTAFSVVGGGDTVAAIEKLGLNNKLGFVSTGGGAMLTYLEKGSTPSLDLLG